MEKKNSQVIEWGEAHVFAIEDGDNDITEEVRSINSWWIKD